MLFFILGGNWWRSKIGGNCENEGCVLVELSVTLFIGDLTLDRGALRGRTKEVRVGIGS